MTTSPHCTIVGPIARPKNDALPSAPWLRTTAGNGPAPFGFMRMPARSYATPSTVPRKVQVAPLEDSGLPVTTNDPRPSPVPTCVGESFDEQAAMSTRPATGPASNNGLRRMVVRATAVEDHRSTRLMSPLTTRAIPETRVWETSHNGQL